MDVIEKSPRQGVDSSNIASIGYYTLLRILEVEFHSGGIYQYLDVPEALFNAFIRADSHGRFFWRHIRGEFVYRKIGDAAKHRKDRWRNRHRDSLKLYPGQWAFEMLGVTPATPLEEARKRYLKLAHVHHPDKGGDVQMMKRLNEAWELVKAVLG